MTTKSKEPPPEALNSTFIYNTNPTNQPHFPYAASYNCYTPTSASPNAFFTIYGV